MQTRKPSSFAYEEKSTEQGPKKNLGKKLEEAFVENGLLHRVHDATFPT